MLKLYNSKSKKIESAQLNKDDVKIYLCGPTVQSEPHIGHGRSAVVFDVLVRYLRFKEYKVKFVRNITDIDDKIIEKANEKKISISQLAEIVTDEFYESYKNLNCLKPDVEPKATENIDNILRIIKILIDKDYAYTSESGIYFDTTRYEDYLSLSGRTFDDVVSGERVTLETDKRNNSDFALWKFSKENEPFWNSEWGKGRPGWHIECSAMIDSIFGGGIDIHCGGNDLIFPHHENEQAQSVSAFQGEFVKYWLHNGMINLSGQKMSKSEGNIKKLNEYIANYGGEVIRFFYLRAHYRKPQEFSEDILEESLKTYKRLVDTLNGVDPEISNQEMLNLFEDCISEDLNTPKLIGEIFTILNSIKQKSETEQLSIKQTIKYFLNILGFELNQITQINDDELNNFFKKYGIEFKNIDEAMAQFIKVRNEAREQKNYKLSDELREKLNLIGIKLNDGKDNEWYWSSS